MDNISSLFSGHKYCSYNVLAAVCPLEPDIMGCKTFGFAALFIVPKVPQHIPHQEGTS
jgi:hypothetical protein